MSKPRSKTTAEARKEKVEKALKGLGPERLPGPRRGQVPERDLRQPVGQEHRLRQEAAAVHPRVQHGQEVGGEHQAHQALHPAPLAGVLLQEARRREEDLDAERRLLLRPGLQRGVHGPGRVGRAHHRPRGAPRVREGGVQRLPGGEERHLRQPHRGVHGQGATRASVSTSRRTRTG